MWPFKRKKWEKLGIPLSSERLASILRNGLAPKGMDLRDRAYRAIPYKDFEWLMMARNVEPKYRAEIFDCDNFAVCFMADLYRIWADKSDGNEALAFGYIKGELPDKGGCHAWIWVVDEKGLIHFVEPQTDGLGKTPFATYYLEA